MSKGSARRKRQVSRKQVDDNWAQTFKQKTSNNERQTDLPLTDERQLDLWEINNGTCICGRPKAKAKFVGWVGGKDGIPLGADYVYTTDGEE